MSDFDRLLELTGSTEVIEGVALPKVQLHKWLVLGQTDYLCENGTLSDGHEKFTSAQKYSQALKEQYYIALNMSTQKAIGMEAQADLLDAQKALDSAVSEADRLRAGARLERAKAALVGALTSVEDQARMLRFYRNKAASLKAEVETKYPKGIEQAEKDNWRSVAEYRRLVETTPGMSPQIMSNVPLDAVTKAGLGVTWNRQDMIAPLQVADQDQIERHAGGIVRYIIDKRKELKQLENK